MATVVVPALVASVFAGRWLFGGSRWFAASRDDRWTWKFEGDKQQFNEKERQYLSGWNSNELITASFDSVRGLSKSLTTYDEHQTEYRNTKLPETRYSNGSIYGKEFGTRHAKNIKEAKSKGKSLMYNINFDTKTVVYYHFNNGSNQLSTAKA